MTNANLRNASPVMILGILVMSWTSGVYAQVTKAQLDSVTANTAGARSFFSTLPKDERKMLSGAALNFFNLVNRAPDLEEEELGGQGLPAAPMPGPTSGPVPFGMVPVSNPATDFLFGPSAGFTQSETSTAWCGNTVLVGFNDSGSYWQSGFATGFTGLSFNGYALSTNKGMSYTDMGYLPSATTNPFNYLLGDPVVACGAGPTFYYASLFSTVASFNPFTQLTAISVSKSTGGASFGAPVIAAAKDAFTHFLDKDWMALNPAAPNQLAVTYTDFDNSGAVCGTSNGFPISRTAIEMVASSDGGNTWSSPQVVFQVCYLYPNFPTVQGSQVAFSPGGAVNVAFELYSAGAPTGRQILFAQAPSLGAAFGSVVTAANVTPVGDGFAVQGGIRAFLDIQGMAVDRSGGATNGNLYIVYHDGSNFAKSFNGVPYFYADAKIIRSSNNGANWSAPVRVNNNPKPLPNGLGVDSYMPGVAVDNTTGQVAVCWYDRRNDPLNYRVDRYCGTSMNGGANFTNFRVTPASFLPIHGADDLVNATYMGDYDTVASDSLLLAKGFIGAYQVVSGAEGGTLVPNSDVKAENVQ